jgi:serine phosphatase RsbU (regulator of sigma subunit)
VSLAAEMRWATLPPLSFISDSVDICGALEPAYDIAGDTFDYAVNNGVAHAAIFDAVGHGLAASRLANLAVMSYRHCRRQQRTLTETFTAMDRTVQEEFGEQDFVTTELLELDTRTGRVDILNAGHPPPLLLRQGQIIGEITGDHCLPVGLGDPNPRVTTIALEPNDRIILYTDGITEARSASGEYFGVERLAEHVARAASGDESSPETIRRLIHSVLAHEAGQLRDDASVIAIGWTGRPAR